MCGTRGLAASAMRNVNATPNATVMPMERTKGTDENPSRPNDISVVVIDRKTKRTMIRRSRIIASA